MWKVSLNIVRKFLFYLNIFICPNIINILDHYQCILWNPNYIGIYFIVDISKLQVPMEFQLENSQRSFSTKYDPRYTQTLIYCLLIIIVDSWNRKSSRYILDDKNRLVKITRNKTQAIPEDLPKATFRRSKGMRRSDQLKSKL